MQAQPIGRLHRIPGPAHAWRPTIAALLYCCASAHLHTRANSFQNTKNVQFDHLSWAISTKSRRAVQTEVRTGAIKDAFAKATDYARAAQSVDQVSLRALHISDDSQGGLYTARGATMAAPAAFHKFSSQSVQESEPSVNFVPEPITVESTVHVRLIVV